MADTIAREILLCGAAKGKRLEALGAIAVFEDNEATLNRWREGGVRSGGVTVVDTRVSIVLLTGDLGCTLLAWRRVWESRSHPAVSKEKGTLP